MLIYAKSQLCCIKMDPFACLKGNVFVFILRFVRIVDCKLNMLCFILFKLLGMPLVSDQILSYLDHKTLKNIRLVCRAWNETINNVLLKEKFGAISQAVKVSINYFPQHLKSLYFSLMME